MGEEDPQEGGGSGGPLTDILPFCSKAPSPATVLTTLHWNPWFLRRSSPRDFERAPHGQIPPYQPPSISSSVLAHITKDAEAFCSERAGCIISYFIAQLVEQSFGPQAQRLVFHSALPVTVEYHPDVFPIPVPHCSCLNKRPVRLPTEIVFFFGLLVFCVGFFFRSILLTS